VARRGGHLTHYYYVYDRVRRETGDSRYFSTFDNRTKSVATILKISISKPFRECFFVLSLFASKVCAIKSVDERGVTVLMFYEPMVLLLDIW
jgi:hypothetical protein